MINLESIVNDNNKKHNEDWSYVPDNPHRILIIGDSGSGKTNTLLTLINEQIYLYPKDLYEPKYEHLMKNRENAEIKHLNDLKAFIVCSNTMDDVYENIDHYNPKRKRKVLYDDMIADIMTNKKFQSIITELFIRSYLGLLGLISLIFLYQKT